MFWLFKEKEEVQRTLDELRKQAQNYQLDELINGDWFVTFIGDTLEGYAKKVDLDYFKNKYPRSSVEEIIEKRINRAKKQAAIEGALSAGAYTAAVAAIIASGGTSSVVSLPAGVVAFVTDLLFSTRLQLILAYDMSVLYGHPVDLDKPGEMHDLLRVALGEKPAEALILNGDDEELTEAAKRAVHSLAENAAKISKKTLTMVGRKLIKQALVKLTLPAASIPLSSAMNYYSAGRTARLARKVYKDKAAVRDLVPEVARAGLDEPRLLLEALWLIVNADEKSSQESWLIEEVAETLKDTEAGEEAMATLKELQNTNTDMVLTKLSWAPDPVKKSIYEAVCKAASIDHEITPKEQEVLHRLAKACSIF